MNDADFTAQQKRVRALYDSWVPILGLAAWNIDIDFYRGELPEPDRDASMSCKTNWQYMRTEIRVNCAAIARCDDRDLEAIFLHELAHVFVNELRSGSSDNPDLYYEHEERVCTMLGKSWQWTREAALGLLVKVDNHPEAPKAWLPGVRFDNVVERVADDRTVMDRIVTRP